MSKATKNERRKLMGCCEDCMFAQKREGMLGFTTYYVCTLLNQRAGDDGEYYRVSAKGSCDHFTERITFSNSNYKSNSKCYLTSACVGHLGKPDDCEELTILRVFRDLYMGNTEEGRALVKEYYEVAPKIVEKIDASKDKDKYYNRIYEKVQKCIGLIKERKYKEAQDEYILMTKTLKDELL